MIPAVATAQNSPPIADAGPDQAVFVGDPVQLDGTASFDPDGDPIVLYVWVMESMPVGSSAGFDSPFNPTPTFSADIEGEYVVSLVVNDGELDSVADTVRISAAVNQPPTAVAAADPLTGPFPLTVVFDGTRSFDSEGGILEAEWYFGDVSVPVPAIEAVHTYTAPGTYHALLTVVDEQGLVDTDSIEITVCGSGINCPPIADAGEDQTAYLGESLELAGSATDHDGDEIVSWAWSIDSAPAGSSASFDDAGIPNPVFSPDLLGQYVLSLVASDGTDTSQPDTLTITLEESPPKWGEAFVVGMQPESPSKGLNCLIGLLIPLGAVLLWKELWRR